MFAIVPTSYVLGIAIVEDLGYLGSEDKQVCSKLVGQCQFLKPMSQFLVLHFWRSLYNQLNLVTKIKTSLPHTCVGYSPGVRGVLKSIFMWQIFANWGKKIQIDIYSQIFSFSSKQFSKMKKNLKTYHVSTHCSSKKLGYKRILINLCLHS